MSTTKNLSVTKVIIPCRISFANIWEPKAINGGGGEKFFFLVVPQNEKEKDARGLKKGGGGKGGGKGAGHFRRGWPRAKLPVPFARPLARPTRTRVAQSVEGGRLRT